MLLKKDIIQILKHLNIKSSDTILIHSSLKAIGEIEGNAEGLLEVLMDYLKDGLLIFPTHTWDKMLKDNDTFDVSASPSCVGALTNIARKTKGFIRSMHPTHSVCAYGKNAKAYIQHDLIATTPVGPNNCFGILKEYAAKILFLGAPLSKNTFIHSIEEEFNVPNRFTEHIYHFKVINNNKIIDYFMPKHYSTLSLHISEHYEKLLPIFLKKGIAKKFIFGNATSYILDSIKSHQLVSSILSKDLHAFDNFETIEHLVD